MNGSRPVLEPGRRTSTKRILSALVLFALYLALGFLVAGPPGLLDRDESALAGHSIGLALFFTRAGLFPTYAVLCVLTLVFGVVRREYLRASLTIVVTLVLAWMSSDSLKLLFHRARPAEWYGMHETSFSYASGHATNAIVFYGLWAFVAYRAMPPSPLRTAIVVLLCVWIAAIGWSRLALGAHYPTDVLGGYVLGEVWLLLGMAFIDSGLARRAERAAT